MLYKDFKGLRISALGMGAMRLPLLAGSDVVDEVETAEMVALAMEQGVNYFDTAYGYHGGQSEAVLGNALRMYPRDSYFLADKFPGYDLAHMGSVEDIFAEQLERCGVDYFDFYMYHNVCQMNIDAYLDPAHGIFDYLCEQKQNGRIRHLGFSAHGNLDVMRRFLEAHGEAMEFCQIQLNYLDWTFQDAKAKVELLGQYNIPVWVMEPLRGGQLTKLADDDAKKLAALRPEETIPAWAFHFLQTIPGVTVVLSGMSTSEQLRDNIQTFDAQKPLSPAEFDALMGVADGMVRRIALPCTACRYCVDHCPQKLDIPNLIALYNEHCFTGGGFLAPMALMATPEDKHPSACVGCKGCEAVCPQQIGVADAMADFAAKLAR